MPKALNGARFQEHRALCSTFVPNECIKAIITVDNLSASTFHAANERQRPKEI